MIKKKEYTDNKILGAGACCLGLIMAVKTDGSRYSERAVALR